MDLGTPDPLELTLLQHTKQFRLEGQCQLAHLVQKNGSAFR